MLRRIVKVGRYNNQIRITIPKPLAVESGLFDTDLAEVKMAGHNKLEVIALDSEEKKGSGRDGNRADRDRSPVED